MRARPECRVKDNLKEGYVETVLDPEATDDVRHRLGVFDSNRKYI